ncbi:MAG: urea amidolyase associated protein UAAP1 [Pseudomonadota bacterium]
MAHVKAFSDDVIAAAKTRYSELKARGQDGSDFSDRAEKANVPAAPELPRLEETIPGGWYWHGLVKRGEAVRISNTSGTPGVSVLLWNSDERSERLNPGDTIKVQWTARISTGRVLLSDMGRAMASITADTCGYTDFVAGGSTPEAIREKYGAGPEALAFSTRDHLLKVAGKYGLGKRDVGPVATLFASVVTDSDGALIWDETVQLKNTFVDLRAEMNLIMAVVNTPHPLSVGDNYEPKPIKVTVFDPGPVTSDDLTRTGTDEAIRAFENTDPLFA